MNHEKGSCDYCLGIDGNSSAVEQILLEGMTLTVLYNDENGKFQSIQFEGKAMR